MPDDTAAFPPLHVYALAHRCSTCGAEPRVPCDAPRKEAAFDSRAEMWARAGRPQPEFQASQLIHATRQEVGRRHYLRDVERAPWPEEQQAGRRYDSLGDLR
jgi:hypothetical protein